MDLTLAVVTLMFGILALIITVVYGIFNNGKIGVPGVPGPTGATGPQGLPGPAVSRLVRSCYTPTNKTFVMPTLEPAQFKTNNEIYFDATIIGYSNGLAEASLAVTLTNAGVQKSFVDLSNTVILVLPLKIGVLTVRVCKGVDTKTLNVCVVNTSKNVGVITTNSSSPTTLTDIDLESPMFLTFNAITALPFTVLGRILTVPSVKSF
jgi:hypothetical protein